MPSRALALILLVLVSPSAVQAASHRFSLLGGGTIAIAPRLSTGGFGGLAIDTIIVDKKEAGWLLFVLRSSIELAFLYGTRHFPGASDTGEQLQVDIAWRMNIGNILQPGIAIFFTSLHGYRPADLQKSDFGVFPTVRLQLFPQSWIGLFGDVRAMLGLTNVTTDRDARSRGVQFMVGLRFGRFD